MALLTHLWMCQICKKQPKSQEDRMVTELLCQHLKCRSCFISETNGCLVCQKVVTIENKSVVTVNPNFAPNSLTKSDVGRRTQTKRLSQIANQLVVQKSVEICQKQAENADTPQGIVQEQLRKFSVVSESRVKDEIVGAQQSVPTSEKSQIAIDRLDENSGKRPTSSSVEGASKRKMIAKELKPVEYGFNANGELYKKRAKPRFLKAYECVYCSRRFFNAGGMGNHIKYIHRDLVMRPKMTGDYSSVGINSEDNSANGKGVSKHFREIDLQNQTSVQEELHSIQ